MAEGKGSSEKPLWRRILGKTFRYGSLAFVVFALALLVMAWRPMGKMAEGERRARMEGSNQWAGSAFENPAPLENDIWGMILGASRKSDYASPSDPLPVRRVPRGRFEDAPESGLRITWLGHSTLLIEIDGITVLTDPVWGERVSPFTWAGPARWYAPPLSIDDLPDLDAILLSHDHYDHLDQPSIEALAQTQDAPFIMPLGVGAHLAYWGVPEGRIVELDWWDEHSLGAIALHCTPARHASGRQVFDQNKTLWAGYALIGPRRRMFFSGDTGLFNEMKEIAERYGPFDIAAIEVGAYDRAWPDWHMGPEQAVTATHWLNASALLPVHWGLFDLALHGWTAPIERVLAKAGELPVASPPPGGTFEIDALPNERWWPDTPFLSGVEDPICANEVDPNECP